MKLNVILLIFKISTTKMRCILVRIIYIYMKKLKSPMTFRGVRMNRHSCLSKDLNRLTNIFEISFNKLWIKEFVID